MSSSQEIKNTKIKNRELLLFLIVAILFTFLSRPNQFNEDSGPTSFETWKVNETKLNITLVKISENPKSATFTNGIERIILQENEWGSLSGETYKIRIYPEKDYVWVIWKEGDLVSHILKSSVLWIAIGTILLYLRRKGFRDYLAT